MHLDVVNPDLVQADGESSPATGLNGPALPILTSDWSSLTILDTDL